MIVNDKFVAEPHHFDEDGDIDQSKLTKEEWETLLSDTVDWPGKVEPRSPFKIRIVSE